MLLVKILNNLLKVKHPSACKQIVFHLCSISRAVYVVISQTPVKFTVLILLKLKQVFYNKMSIKIYLPRSLFVHTLHFKLSNSIYNYKIWVLKIIYNTRMQRYLLNPKCRDLRVHDVSFEYLLFPQKF